VPHHLLLHCVLQAAHDLVHSALSSQIHRCLTQCGWPPPVVPPKAGTAAAVAGATGALFSPEQADETNKLQRLMLALTRLQLVSQQEQISAAVQVRRWVQCSDGGHDAVLCSCKQGVLCRQQQLQATTRAMCSQQLQFRAAMFC
jgi:hypothetical protein